MTGPSSADSGVPNTCGIRASDEVFERGASEVFYVLAV